MRTLRRSKHLKNLKQTYKKNLEKNKLKVNKHPFENIRNWIYCNGYHYLFLIKIWKCFSRKCRICRQIQSQKPLCSRTVIWQLSEVWEHSWTREKETGKNNRWRWCYWDQGRPNPDQKDTTGEDCRAKVRATKVHTEEEWWRRLERESVNKV